MKKGNKSFNQRLTFLFFLSLIIINISCNDALKEEIETLKAENQELMSQIDISNSTISELESKKEELEAQKASLQSDTIALNNLILQLERMIASRYIERYLTSIMGPENYSSYQWKHLYDENLQLYSSIYTRSNANDFDYWEILDGKTSQPVKKEITHHYENGVLVSSTSNDEEIKWNYVNGRISEIRTSIIDQTDNYVVFKINENTGNVKTSEHYNISGLFHTYTYSYNEHDLVIKIESVSSQRDTELKTFDYDENLNLINYKESYNGKTLEEKRYAFNEDGKIVKLINIDTDQYDSLVVDYLQNGSWEIYFEGSYTWDEFDQNKRVHKRKYDKKKNLVFYFEQFGNNAPLQNEYEFTNGFETKRINYNYAKSSSGDWYISSTKTHQYTRDNDGTLLTEDQENLYFLEDGSIDKGFVFRYSNITFSSDQSSKLSYTKEEFDIDTKELMSKIEYVGIEYQGDISYQKKYTEYYIENGSALYISETWEITEFYETAPFAPKVKVRKLFDKSGEINSYRYSNSVNSENAWQWYWVLI